MSLFPSTVTTITSRPARQRATGAAMAALTASLAAILAALPAAPAMAQNGPVTRPATGSQGISLRSGDPGMAEAEQASAQKRYDEAIDRFDRVLAANPRNVQARFERAWALSQAGREDQAITAFSEIAQDFPELPEPHNNLALLYARRGDLKRAEAELLLALDVKPTFAIGYTNLGDVYRRLAEQAYAQGLKYNPADARAKASLDTLRAAAPPAAAKPAAPLPSAPANPRSVAPDTTPVPLRTPARGVPDLDD